MRAVVWIVTIIGCIAGAFVATAGLLAATSAPQEASAAAVGVAFAVIPYCFARATEAVRLRELQEMQTIKLGEILAELKSVDRTTQTQAANATNPVTPSE